MTEDQMRAIMLLAKAAWYYDPVSDQLTRRDNFDAAMRDMALIRLYGPECAAAVEFIQKVTEPATGPAGT